MSVLMRNVSNCCEHQFGTPVVNVCDGEKCVSLEHLLSMSVADEKCVELL